MVAKIILNDVLLQNCVQSTFKFVWTSEIMASSTNYIELVFKEH